MGLSLDTPAETSEDGNTGLAVFIQDQTTPVIDLFFHRELQTTTLSATAVVDTRTFEMTAGHGFVTGQGIFILEGQNFSQFNVANVVTNTITVDSPIDVAYTVASTVFRKTFDLREDGSSTPVVFTLTPNPGQIWDITRIILAMESSANDMDFTEFGSLAALTLGCVLRVKNGTIKNIFNWKTNGEFINRSFDHSFQSKTAGGGSGFTARSTFGGQSRRGVVIRLDGDKNEEMQIVIQDNISAVGTLTKFNVIAQGHVTQ